MNSIPVRFDSAGDPMVGMLHPAGNDPETGILVMVAGGPQYRVGGHRQLVLWSRRFSAQGFPVFRFDFRGMGDSYGLDHGFEHAEGDIRAALDKFFAEVPSLRQVVLWGECNACSAALFFAHKDPRIKGIVMLNPWVRTEEGQAKAVIKHYYLNRIMQRSFWSKVFRLQFDLVGSLRSAAQMIRKAKGATTVATAEADHGRVLATDGRPLPERMLDGLSRFKGQIMLIMSGRDQIAREFDDLLASSPAWRQQLQAHATVRHDLKYADHTFSTGVWRDQVAAWGVSWLARFATTAPRICVESGSAAPADALGA